MWIFAVFGGPTQEAKMLRPASREPKRVQGAVRMSRHRSVSTAQNYVRHAADQAVGHNVSRLCFDVGTRPALAPSQRAIMAQG